MVALYADCSQSSTMQDELRDFVEASRDRQGREVVETLREATSRSKLRSKPLKPRRNGE